MNARRASALALLLLCALVFLSVADARPVRGPGDPRHRVDINAAPAHELELLPRIGPALSGAIVASREGDGSFGTIDELDRVVRIGAKTVEGLRPYARAR